MEKFKSLYQDGLIPTKEYHVIAKDVGKTIDSLFKKYVDEGYSPREITELIYSIVGGVGTERALILTLKRKAAQKKSLTKSPDDV